MPTRLIAFLISAGFVLEAGTVCRAGDVRIPIPTPSRLTPVQKLNREGVSAIRKHDYAKAEALFYKAYLYDAADPFTLNNLGYVSELEGHLDRAQRFYALAAEQGDDARIDASNEKQLKGQPMEAALSGLKDTPMQVNRMNVQAIDLLHQDRNMEAYILLRKALTLEPHNAFTLNNLGVANESLGDATTALTYYDEAANADSAEPVVVTLDHRWMGKPVSAMAAASAKRLRRETQNQGVEETRAIMLASRGVTAINENNWAAARADFSGAYSADPHSAFSLNNLGYIAEKDGDLETAQFYYNKAQKATNAREPVGLATRLAAQGQPIDTVASASNVDVDHALALYSQAARQQTGPIQLIPRGAATAKPTTPLPAQPPSAAPKEQKPQTSPQ